MFSQCGELAAPLSSAGRDFARDARRVRCALRSAPRRCRAHRCRVDKSKPSQGHTHTHTHAQQPVAVSCNLLPKRCRRQRPVNMSPGMRRGSPVALRGLAALSVRPRLLASTGRLRSHQEQPAYAWQRRAHVALDASSAASASSVVTCCAASRLWFCPRSLRVSC